MGAGIFLFIIGLFLLVKPQPGLTGAFVGIPVLGVPFLSSSLGVLLMGASLLLVMTAHSKLERIALSSAIKKSPPLLRLTHDAVKNHRVERELNHLIHELGKGNFQCGAEGGPGHIEGTDIYYLRGRNGGRLYYHQTAQGRYEIVAKSSKGRNQDQVMDYLRKIYG